MYKEILRSITGIDVFPVVSLILFVVAFATVLVRVVCMDRGSADELARLPLDSERFR